MSQLWKMKTKNSSIAIFIYLILVLSARFFVYVISIYFL